MPYRPWVEQGEAAFPIQHSAESGAYAAETGMSLRDYFAAKAMHGYCTNASSSECTYSEFAADAYEMADAMLKERQK